MFSIRFFFSFPFLPHLQDQGEVPPPHLVVVSPGQYDPERERFDMPEHDARDKLLPKGHQFCKSEEYRLGIFHCISVL